MKKEVKRYSLVEELYTYSKVLDNNNEVDQYKAMAKLKNNSSAHPYFYGDIKTQKSKDKILLNYTVYKKLSLDNFLMGEVYPKYTIEEIDNYTIKYENQYWLKKSLKLQDVKNNHHIYVVYNQNGMKKLNILYKKDKLYLNYITENIVMYDNKCNLIASLYKNPNFNTSTSVNDSLMKVFIEKDKLSAKMSTPKRFYKAVNDYVENYVRTYRRKRDLAVFLKNKVESYHEKRKKELDFTENYSEMTLKLEKK